MKNEDGSYTQYTAKIHPFLTHQQTKPKFHGKCSFEITEMTFQTSVGTYLDSPFHRYSNGRDISELKIEELILTEIVIDVKGEFEAIGLDAIPKKIDLKGKAVLFNFRWDEYWGTEKYQSYPFISKEVVEFLIKSGVKLVGVDTVNIDSSKDLTIPAHSLFLKKEIFIVENLTNVDKLQDKKFTFFAVPIKGKKIAAMPIRAYAQVE